MRVERYSGDIAAAASSYGISEEQLIARDEDRALPARRWLAYEGSAPVGAVTAWLRPDDRLFLDFGCRLVGAYEALTHVVAEEERRPVYVSISGDEQMAMAGLLHAGYEVEIVFERFDVEFVRVLGRLRDSRVPDGFEILSARECDIELLLKLDDEIRSLVPGTSGWAGSLDWIEGELAEEPPFDPGSYLVGVAPGGTYAGLVRIWRNPDGPRFGLVGVLPRFRRSMIGPALMAKSLRSAATWDWDSFTTETAIANHHIHPRLMAANAKSTGYLYQLAFGWSG